MTPEQQRRVFKNCNVCGRELLRDDELDVGCCSECFNEEEPDAKETVRMRKWIPLLDRSLRVLLEKRARLLRKIETRWRECGETECAAIYQGAAFELELLLKS